MKRLLLIFLLAMLPLQMSWAAVTGYCQHEEGKAAQHLGHHEHKHQASGDSKQSDKKSKNQLGVNDVDCGYCHLSCLNIVSQPQPELAFPKASTPVEFQFHPYRSHIPDGLTKPDWQLAI
jgi:hypothetical protein